MTKEVIKEIGNVLTSGYLTIIKCLLSYLY